MAAAGPLNPVSGLDFLVSGIFLDGQLEFFYSSIERLCKCSVRMGSHPPGSSPAAGDLHYDRDHIPR